MREVLLIADSGPIIALVGINHLELLPQLYRRVAAPAAVIDEIAVGGRLLPAIDIAVQAPWLERLDAPSELDSLSVVLGRGEAEAIALARQEPNTLLLLDDHQARRAAESLNLLVTGSAGVLVRAKREGLIPAIKPLLLGIRANGYRISDRVLQRACREAGEEDKPDES